MTEYVIDITGNTQQKINPHPLPNMILLGENLVAECSDVR